MKKLFTSLWELSWKLTASPLTLNRLRQRRALALIYKSIKHSRQLPSWLKRVHIYCKHLRTFFVKHSPLWWRLKAFVIKAAKVKWLFQSRSFVPLPLKFQMDKFSMQNATLKALKHKTVMRIIIVKQESAFIITFVFISYILVVSHRVCSSKATLQPLKHRKQVIDHCRWIMYLSVNPRNTSCALQSRIIIDLFL